MIMFKKIFSFVLCLFVFNPVLGFTSDSESRGLEIALKMRKASEGFIGESSQMEMVLIDAYGSETKREMQGHILEVKGDGDRSLMIFMSPSDVRGTRMLTWSKREGNDDQWLYLPSLRRVRRISSNNRMSSFMGSEFSFEDLGSQEVERYNFKFLKDDKYNDEEVHVLQRVPKDRSGYSKMVMYVSKSKLLPLKIEYFDRREELLKTGEFKNHTEYKVGNKKVWRSNEIHMNNVQTQKKSIFRWSNRSVGVEHQERMFTQGALSE